uniref:Peptidase M20 n=1 Tax=Pfiesteria piscicida TaxID=71001 RepID=A3E3K9_PFIPI|nr:peptidase M20 [Pfiesteria piscicida]
MALPEPTKALLDNTYWLSLIGLRREIHMHPEPGFKEVRTSARSKEVLMKFAGVEESQIRTMAITGMIVDIKGKGPAKPDAPVKCIALRSDLDALTMTEGNNGLPYRSKNKGVAHMCGHDGHISALVGIGILLQHRLDRIPSNLTVRLLFQPAEESSLPGTTDYDHSKTGGGGAMPMIMDGCLEGVDEVYGWHNWPAWNLGELVVRTGTIMAHCCNFEVVIHGRGGHGSQPQACIDPVVCAANIVGSLQTIVSRSLPSSAIGVVTVAQFHAGERMNVIPDTATFSGTIRDEDPKVFDAIKRRFNELINGACKAYGCTADINLIECYPAVINKEEGRQTVERAAAKLEGPVALRCHSEGLPLMGAEDFSFYLQQRPGAFFCLGTQELLLRGLAAYEGAEDTPRSNCICHGTSYDFNDNVLPRAVLMFLRIVEDRFGLDLHTQDEVLGFKEASAPKRQRTA